MATKRCVRAAAQRVKAALLGIGVVHDVVLRPDLRDPGADRRTRTQDVRPERVRVKHIRAAPGEEVGQPRGVTGQEGARKVAPRALGGAAPVVERNAGGLEEAAKPNVVGEEGDLVVAPRALRAPHEVDQQALGAANRTADDEVHDARSAHGNTAVSTTRVPAASAVGPSAGRRPSAANGVSERACAG